MNACCVTLSYARESDLDADIMYVSSKCLLECCSSIAKLCKNCFVLLLGSGYHLQDVHNDHVQCTKK